MTRTTIGEPRPRSRTTSLFLAGHLVAVSVVYAAAWSIGGGFAPPPFPPDVPVEVHQPSIPRVANDIDESVPPATLMAPASMTSDIPSPWTFDTEGRVRFAPR